MYIIQF